MRRCSRSVSLDAVYGMFQALFGVDLTVDEGETVAVIGANGAGKSTLLKAISRPGRRSGAATSRSTAGRSAGRPRTDGSADGIALVPEGRRIFPSLSVEENLVIGGYRKRPGPWTKQRVYAAFPLLERIANRSAARLSGGEQQMLAIGRALMANPRLLLLDEVSLGLAPVVVQQLYDALPSVRQAGHDAAGGRAGHQPGPGRGRSRVLPARGPHRPGGHARGADPGADHPGLLRRRRCGVP